MNASVTFFPFLSVTRRIPGTVFIPRRMTALRHFFSIRDCFPLPTEAPAPPVSSSSGSSKGGGPSSASSKGGGPSSMSSNGGGPSSAGAVVSVTVEAPSSAAILPLLCWVKQECGEGQ